MARSTAESMKSKLVQGEEESVVWISHPLTVSQVLLPAEVPGGRDHLLPAPQHRGHHPIPLTGLLLARVPLVVTSTFSHEARRVGRIRNLGKR